MIIVLPWYNVPLIMAKGQAIAIRTASNSVILTSGKKQRAAVSLFRSTCREKATETRWATPLS